MTQREKEEQEAQLFLDAVKEVKRIKHRLVERSNGPSGDAPAYTRAVPARDDSDKSSPDESSFLRSGVQLNVLRKLRKGHFPIEGELDLHGYSSAEAEPELRAFLLAARSPDRQRSVRVIHGKGHGSPNGTSVLKQKTQHWLRECDAVLAFCPARPADGGSGALYVLLRKR
ncbi:MAG TPA: Smr/MutS family protein [Terriglobia bacterium]|jgi:DNA-nicking Smr family endonuclease